MWIETNENEKKEKLILWKTFKSVLGAKSTAGAYFCQ